jgi:uncharacterized protein with beta-barrel porin domain
MNRVHRIVWSEARQAYVVTHEGAKANGKPSSTRTAVASAVVMALAAMAAQPAMATSSCSYTATNIIDVAAGVTSTCNLGSADALTVTSTGAIMAPTHGVYVSAAASASSIGNDGTISGSESAAFSANGYGIRVDGAVSSITNSGTISGIANASSSANGYGIQVTGTVSSITNTGTIDGLGNYSHGINIRGSSSSVGSISNGDGTISGSIDGGYNGISLNGGSTVGSITNNLNSSIHASYYSGIQLNNSTVSGSISNNGTISGGGWGSGIALHSGSSAGSIINGDGTISGSIDGGYNGISLNGGSTVGSITNNLNSTIHGGNTGINLTQGSSVGSISNSGTISGSYVGIGIHNGSTVSGGISNSNTISADYGIGIRIWGGSTVSGIDNSGTISGNSEGGIGISIHSGSTVGSISNSGTISGGNYGIYLSNSTISGGISNNGTISGGGTGIDLYYSTITGGITNNAGGTISGGYTGIDMNSSSVDSITNSTTGTISGSSRGIALYNGSHVGSISNSGMISGGSSAGIFLSNSTITGGISNNGTISGGWGGISLDNSNVGNSTISGDISNSGTISGGNYGIYLSNSTISGGITNNAGGTISGGSSAGIALYSSSVGSISNSGTISGSRYAIYADSGSTLANINITGNSTAHFLGDVYAQNTDVAVKTGATFANNSAFDVKSFAIENGATFNMGAGSSTSGMNNGVTVSNGFTNAGKLAVAADTIAHINGNYTQSASGVFETSLATASQPNTLGFSPSVSSGSSYAYGQLVVSGTADLSASNKINVNVVGTPTLAVGDVLAGVISAGTLVAGPAYTVTDNSTLFDFIGTTNGNTVDLTVKLGLTAAGSVASSGNTAAAGAAAVFDTLLNGSTSGNANMATVITALGQLSSQQAVSDAVTQTLPLMTGGMAQATAASLHGVNHIVQARQGESRGLSSGDDFVSNGNAWVKPLGSWAEQKDNNGAFGYKAQTFGVVLGADGELSQDSRLGVAVALTHSNVDSNSGTQNAGVNSYQAIVYGSRSLKDANEINWQADYGYNQNKGDRHIAFVGTTANADYSSDSFHVGAGIGHTMTLSSQTSFTPSFRADYTTISNKGYTETGAGALNLVVNGQSTDEFILALDGKVAQKLSDTASVIANLGMGYDLNAKQNSITAAYQGGGAAFTTDGISPSAMLVRGGLGMVVNASKAMEVTARYDIETRSGFTAQTASVKLKMPF